MLLLGTLVAADTIIHHTCWTVAIILVKSRTIPTGTVLYRASSYYCDQPSSFSQAPSACGVQCSTERLVGAVID